MDDSQRKQVRAAYQLLRDILDSDRTNSIEIEMSDAEAARALELAAELNLTPSELVEHAIEVALKDPKGDASG